ncbi:MAG: UDP-N-acetylmuramate dehydrogenase [Anaerolineae bacterium]|nr:UDP-N-acetylmuramate dehydrogenase [Anaerolineae bacterium]
MTPTTAPIPLNALREAFGYRFQENVLLANYTTAQVGGTADGLLVCNSMAELENAGRALWQLEVPFIILGSGANVLISDLGYRGVVIINRARNVRIDDRDDPPTVWAESGANLGTVSRQAALRGLSGLEWACTIPGTIGGAVVGNAGAFGGDVAGNLLLAEILHPTQSKEVWRVEQLGYGYRTSVLKRKERQALVLAARMKLEHAEIKAVQARMAEYIEKRKTSQPPGASMGSMFKNPEGDHAGKLIEAAGLKGTRIGGAEISRQHANFIVNTGHASASDVHRLILLAQQKVQEHSGIELELEVELLGEWQVNQ